ncbi:MAG: hypothetical protein U0169_21265 [Polyangiaceae bacterium]
MTEHTTLTEAIKEFWRKIRGEKPKRPTMQSDVDLARADWEGMGQSRYTPSEDDEKRPS